MDASITITAESAGKTYGETDPQLTATVTGNLETDEITTVVTRAGGENAGTYEISATVENPADYYDITYITADFTISPASVTLTANDGTATYTGGTIIVNGVTQSGIPAEQMMGGGMMGGMGGRGGWH